MFLCYDIVIRLGASLSLLLIFKYRPKLYLNVFYPHFQIYWTFHNHFLGELVPKPNLNKQHFYNYPFFNIPYMIFRRQYIYHLHI